MRAAPLIGLVLGTAALVFLATSATSRAGKPATAGISAAERDAALIERGRYLVKIGGCNDCHTEGYGEAQGEIPEAQWLLGSVRGFHGPWGTTYPVNLRLRVQDFDEAGWLSFTEHLKARPLMPDFAVRAMTAEDRLAIYRLLRHLGPAGSPAPSFLPPGQMPPPPYLDMVLGPPPVAAKP